MNMNTSAAALVVVEVSDEPVITGRPYTDPKTGMSKPVVDKQVAYVHFGARYPVSFKVKVDKEKGPLRPGFYMMAGRLFKTSQFDGLDFSDRELTLIPVSEAIAELTSMTKVAATGPKLTAAA